MESIAVPNAPTPGNITCFAFSMSLAHFTWSNIHMWVQQKRPNNDETVHEHTESVRERKLIGNLRQTWVFLHKQIYQAICYFIRSSISYPMLNYSWKWSDLRLKFTEMQIENICNLRYLIAKVMNSIPNAANISSSIIQQRYHWIWKIDHKEKLNKSKR